MTNSPRRAPAPKKDDPLLLEFVAFANAANNAEPPIAWDQLGRHMNDNGWVWRARQVNSQLNAQSVLLDFEISVGKIDALDKLAVVDTLSMGVPLSVFNPSMSSRVNLGMSVLYLLFDRLPPMPVQPAAPAPAPGTSGGRPMTDAEIAARRAAEAAARPAPAPAVNGHDPGPGPDMPKEAFEPGELPDVIDGYLKSGLPLFKDVDTMGGPGDDIVEAMLFATEAALDKASDPQQLVEFYERNQRKFAFLNDMGTPDQVAKFKAMLNARAGELQGGGGEPPVRRRQTPA